MLGMCPRHMSFMHLLIGRGILMRGYGGYQNLRVGNQRCLPTALVVVIVEVVQKIHVLMVVSGWFSLQTGTIF